MPDDVIRLVLPAASEFAQVASVAVRAVARQVALPETEIDRLRAAVVDAFTARVGTERDGPVELVLRPRAGRVEASLDGDPLG